MFLKKKTQQKKSKLGNFNFLIFFILTKKSTRNSISDFLLIFHAIFLFIDDKQKTKKMYLEMEKIGTNFLKEKKKYFFFLPKRRKK